MHLGDLAFELQLQVLKLCSRGDLASLCRTHTPMRDVADYALYSHIPGPFHSSSCQDSSFLETLATNDHKASLVRVLDVQLTLGTHDLRGRFLKLIAKMLPSMLNLYELRIAVHNRGFEDTEIPLIQWMSEISVEINQAIRLVCIQATMTTERPSLVQGRLFPAPASMPGGQSVSLGGYQENCRQPARPTTPRILPPQ